LSIFTAVASAAPGNLRLPRVIVSQHGTITQPTADSTTLPSPLVPGTSFPFAYQDSNWCEGGYTPITVWLLDYAPTTGNLNATGQFTDALYSYGLFLIPNFGLKPLPGSAPPPPATLTIPEVPESAIGSPMYLAVVETANTCP
ncbi:hypothetical protein FB45DRAFT_694631, partial [Roridomyces roridus]